MKWVKIYFSCPRVFMNMCTLNASCTLIYSSDSSLEHYFVCESQGFGFKISLGVSSNKYKLVLLSSSIQNWKYHGQCEFLVKLWPNIIFSEVTTLSTVWKIERYRLNYNILGKYYEMPQKECESDRKNGTFQKKHVINLKTEKEPKMKFFRFWGISKNAYAITWKI